MTAEYGIVANVVEIDKVLRRGAKVWLRRAWTGGGYERFVVVGAARGGRQIEKWTPIVRLDNFRVAWMPEHLRPLCSIIGDKAAMEELVALLPGVVARERAAHPGRRGIVEEIAS
jgi:hypothetical protein